MCSHLLIEKKFFENVLKTAVTKIIRDGVYCNGSFYRMQSRDFFGTKCSTRYIFFHRAIYGLIGQNWVISAFLDLPHKLFHDKIPAAFDQLILNIWRGILWISLTILKMVFKCFISSPGSIHSQLYKISWINKTIFSHFWMIFFCVLPLWPLNGIFWHPHSSRVSTMGFIAYLAFLMFFFICWIKHFVYWDISTSALI